MPSLRIVVCEAQVPFVHGGAEVHVRELVRELRERGHPGRAGQRAVQVVSEGGDPAARRGVAAARSQREQRPADRSGDRLEVSDLLRAPSAQSRVADPPVPRRLRAVRHRVQRLQPHRVGRRAPRSADPARHRDARRVPRDLRERAQHGAAAGEVQRPVGRGALPSAAAGGAAEVRTVRRLRAVGRAHRVGEARRPARSARWRRSISRFGSSWPATARSEPTSNGSPQSSASPTASRFSARRPTRCCSISMPARSRCSIRRSTKTSAT